MFTAEQQGPYPDRSVSSTRALCQRFVTGVLCLVLFTAIHTTGSGTPPLAGTRNAIELLGGGKIKNHLPITMHSLTAAL